MTPIYASLVYAAVALVTVFVVIVYKISACSLFALQAYILPDEKNRVNQVEADDKKSRKKKKDKGKFDWNEDGSEILRVNIGDSYLENTRYFPEYDQVITFSALGISLLVASEFLHSQIGEQAAIVPFVTCFCILKLIHILCKVSWDRTSSRNSEWALSFAVGFVGFLVACIVIFAVPRNILDFGLDEAVESSGIPLGSFWTLRLVVATAAAWLTGLQLGPVLKVVRSFWVGTNQLGWDILILTTGVWTKLLLNLSVITPLMTALLWCKPMAELFINRPTGNPGLLLGGSMYQGQDWAAKWGFSEATFNDVKFVGLVISGIIQILLLRRNIQSYLNLGVLAWYESLHGTKTPDAKALKNKIIVINYFMCRVAVQCLVPSVLTVLLAGLSWSSRSSGGKEGGQVFLLLFLKQVAVFLCWWTVFSWALLTCSVLVMFRLGLLLAY